MKIVLNAQSPWKGLDWHLDHLGELLPYAVLWVQAFEDTESWINCRLSRAFHSGCLVKIPWVRRMLSLRGVQKGENPNASSLGQAGTREGWSGPGPKQLGGDCGSRRADSLSQGQQLLLSPGKSYCAGTQANAGSYFLREIRNLDYFPPRTSEFLSVDS